MNIKKKLIRKLKCSLQDHEIIPYESYTSIYECIHCGEMQLTFTTVRYVPRKYALRIIKEHEEQQATVV